MIAAFGIGHDGSKMILGIRQGATENATVVCELLGDLISRGLDFTEPRLYVLDGGKALHAAVKKYGGDSEPIQRCQVHRWRHGQGQANRCPKAECGLRAQRLCRRQRIGGRLHRELMHLNSSAARSLAEGMEENLERSPAACSPATAAYLGQHQRH